MLRRLLGMLSLLLVSPAWAADGHPPVAEIVIASEVWAGHTNADGSGLGWDILRKVYEPVGVRLKIRSVPYTRSVGLVQRHEADAWMGAYRDEIAGAVYPAGTTTPTRSAPSVRPARPPPACRPSAATAWCGSAATTTSTSCQT